ncbi:hypothetical protein AMTR_s00048p00129690 [Amborella trichopoda]|uniref:Uncharacterized protein n=1 Tax=Amborella trichopoda TaxID=13333 RepID=U5D5E5_AMBTC|nr:hypothetical protein AMTR_s00048p00129690 [Amborella trichopoda]
MKRKWDPLEHDMMVDVILSHPSRSNTVMTFLSLDMLLRKPYIMPNCVQFDPRDFVRPTLSICVHPSKSFSIPYICVYLSKSFSRIKRR